MKQVFCERKQKTNYTKKQKQKNKTDSLHNRIIKQRRLKELFS